MAAVAGILFTDVLGKPAWFEAGKENYWIDNNALLAIEFLVLGFLELKRYQVGQPSVGWLGQAGWGRGGWPPACPFGWGRRAWVVWWRLIARGGAVEAPWCWWPGVGGDVSAFTAPGFCAVPRPAT